MKDLGYKFVIILLGMVVGNTSHAGATTEDPMTASLAERFVHAKVPRSASELPIGHEILCTGFETRTGSTQTQEIGAFTFRTYDSILRTDGVNSKFDYMVFTKDGVAGNSKYRINGIEDSSPATRVLYRVEQTTGDLIAEVSVVSGTLYGYSEISIAFPSRVIVRYDLCPKRWP
jgi:hypothetical protein